MFNSNSNTPSKGTFKDKGSWKGKNIFRKDDGKKDVLNDILNILGNPESSENTERPKVVVNEKRLPFTVVRVSSSVSQVRTHADENNIRVSGKIESVTKSGSGDDLEDEEFTNALFFPPRTTPKTTLDRDSFNKILRNSLSPAKRPPLDSKKDEKKSRPPFLKPVAKFPDIRIPSLDKKKKNNLFKNNRPLSPVLGLRTTTTTEPTPRTTIDELSLDFEPIVCDNCDKFEGSTTTPRTFNAFKRFRFTTPEGDKTTESPAAVKSLIDLIPKVKEAGETTSSRSLIELIPGVSHINAFDLEEGKGNNVVIQESDNKEGEVSTLRASLEIVPIRSTTDRNTPNDIDEFDIREDLLAKFDEIDSEKQTVPGTNKDRDLEIIPIPPRPPRPTTEDSTTAGRIELTEEVPTVRPEQTTRKLSRLEQIVQSRRTTTTSTINISSGSPPTESVRTANRPTISIRFRDRSSNPTEVSKITTNSENNIIKQNGEIKPTDETQFVDAPETTDLDFATTRHSGEEEEDITTELSTPKKVLDNPKPTIGGRGRSKSRFRPKLSELFPKRKRPSGGIGSIAKERPRPFLRPKNRSTVRPSTDEDEVNTTEPSTAETTPSFSNRNRRPTFRRFTTKPTAIPKNTKSPLLKSILERARQRAALLGRRTTRAPIKVINKVCFSLIFNNFHIYIYIYIYIYIHNWRILFGLLFLGNNFSTKNYWRIPSYT